jgi:predicted RNA-binding protein with EMAP domain
MSYDTSKDPRILVAHLACERLKRAAQQKSGVKLSVSKEKLVELASSADSAVMTLMYMYQEPRDLVGSDPMNDLLETARSLSGALAPLLAGEGAPALLKANVAWCLRTLSGLPARLDRPAESMAAGVDLVVVQVRNVAKIGSLWRTRVTDDETEYTVITNIPGVRVGDVLAAAFLPPREVGGEISEAMFLGDENHREAPGSYLTTEQVDAREAAAIMHEELERR